MVMPPARAVLAQRGCPGYHWRHQKNPRLFVFAVLPDPYPFTKPAGRTCMPTPESCFLIAFQVMGFSYKKQRDPLPRRGWVWVKQMKAFLEEVRIQGTYPLSSPLPNLPQKPASIQTRHKTQVLKSFFLTPKLSNANFSLSLSYWHDVIPLFNNPDL